MLKVAVRHELFSQVHADRRLRELGSKLFMQLAVKYGVGTSRRDDRPHGLTALVLSDDIVSDLTTGETDEEGN